MDPTLVASLLASVASIVGAICWTKRHCKTVDAKRADSSESRDLYKWVLENHPEKALPLLPPDSSGYWAPRQLGPVKPQQKLKPPRLRRSDAA